MILFYLWYSDCSMVSRQITASESVCLIGHSDICKVLNDILRADSRFAPSQWETSLQSNAVSHWLGTNLESALILPEDEPRITFESTAIIMLKINWCWASWEIWNVHWTSNSQVQNSRQWNEHLMHSGLVSPSITYICHHWFRYLHCN